MIKDAIIKSYIEERNLLVSDVYSNTSFYDDHPKVKRLQYIDSILLKYLDRQPTNTEQSE